MLLGWEEKRQGSKQQEQHTQQSQNADSDGDDKDAGPERS